MNNSHNRFVTSLAIGALVAAGVSTLSAQSAERPIVITPPAVKDGSNWSRAPFPAARQFDDVKAPDGVAIDKTGANSDSANIEPPTPPARVAILQPAQSAPAQGILADPGLLPTGRVMVASATSIDALTYSPTIRSASISSRDQVITDIEARLKASEATVTSFRNTTSTMSTDGRRMFKSADDEVKGKAQALKKSLKSARKASESQWDNARAQLASDYEAYGAALARVDAAAGIAPATR